MTNCTMPQYKAVIFDVGGVIIDSPLHAIAKFEKAYGIEHNFLNKIIIATGRNGSFSRLERGEIDLSTFARMFEKECETAGQQMDGIQFVQECLTWRPSSLRSEMLEAVKKLRKNGFKVAALTNNFHGDDAAEPLWKLLKSNFDVFIESRLTKMRKPDPRIYALVLSQLGVQGNEAIFLDDIGMNLKPAKELGMGTIRVVTTAQALAELEVLVGIPLRASNL